MMKTLLVTILLIAGTQLQGQALEQAVDVIGKGEVEKLGTWMGTDIEVCILNDVDFYSREEAISTLKRFFAKHPPRSVSVIHKGVSKNSDSKFIIAQLNAGNQTFRLYLYGSQEGKQLQLEEIRIEKE